MNDEHRLMEAVAGPETFPFPLPFGHRSEPLRYLDEVCSCKNLADCLPVLDSPQDDLSTCL